MTCHFKLLPFWKRLVGMTANVPTALRSGGERETNVSDSTKLSKREQNFKLNINPPFCKTDVSGGGFIQN